MKNASSCVFKQTTGLLYFCSDRGVKKRSEFGMVLMVVVEMMVVITIINYGGDVGTKDWDEGDGGGLYLS